MEEVFVCRSLTLCLLLSFPPRSRSTCLSNDPTLYVYTACLLSGKPSLKHFSAFLYNLAAAVTWVLVGLKMVKVP